jgi:hypothetical protein
LTINNGLTLSGNLTNAGTATWSGGAMNGSGTFANQSGGTFNATVATALSFAPNFTNQSGATFTRSGSNTATFSGTFNNAGTVQVNSAMLSLTGTVTQYSGTTLTGGTWSVTGTLNFPSGPNITTIGSAATVTLTGNGASFPKLYNGTTGTLLTNQGVLTLHNVTNTFFVVGTTTSPFTNTGTVTIDGSILWVESNNNYVQMAGTTAFSGGGILKSNRGIGSGAVAQFTGSTVTGNGLFEMSVSNGATFSPGSSPGRLSITGNYTQTSAGALDIEIAGYTSETPNDQLAVSGLATLDGTLNVSEINEFTPQAGQTFQILTFGSRGGDFAQKNGLAFTGGQFDPAYSPDDLTLTAAPEATSNPVVTNTYDSGPGSLRQAILDANSNEGFETITFDIPTIDLNYHSATHSFTIRPTSPLPSITDSVMIDGTSEWSVVGISGRPSIELNGASAGGDADGLTVASGADGSMITGLVVNGFTGDGIELDSDGNTVTGDYIGTNVTGTLARSNSGTGIRVNSTGNMIFLKPDFRQHRFRHHPVE